MTLLTFLAACARAPEAPLPQTMAPCPDSPNCVSSMAPPDDEEHHVAAFSTNAPWKRLIEVVDEMPRSEIVTQTDTYVHFVFTTALFRFRDDVEFQLEPETGTIQVRSASRVGHSDLGVNRKRVEQIREALAP